MGRISCRLLAAALALSFSSPAVHAGKAGLGVQVNSSGTNAVLFPVQTQTQLIIEPEFSYSKTRDEYYDSSGDSSTALGPTDYRYLSLGIGLYKPFARREQSYGFAGMRLGIFSATYEDKDADGNRNAKFETKGMVFAPTIGVAYEPYDRVSFSIDAALNYFVAFEDFDSDGSYSAVVNDRRQLTTPVRFIARFFF